MSRHDYSTWLTKAQAAEAIGVSTKTIEKLAAEKKLQQAYYKKPDTGASISVYHPDDVDRLRKERNPDATPFVLPPEPPSEKAPTQAVTVREAVAPATVDVLVEKLALALSSQNSQTTPAVPLSQRVFLTLAEASTLTGLGVSFLRGMVAKGELKLLKGAGVRGADVVFRMDLFRLAGELALKLTYPDRSRGAQNLAVGA